MSSSTLLGAVVLFRHGDRQGFYQNPETYTASATAITALGALQAYELGEYLRATYGNISSSSYIQDLQLDLFKQSQIIVRADAGGEGGVIYDSTLAVTQGLWQNTTKFTSELANGTVVLGPMNGYQYVPIESVEPAQDVSLEGWTSCNAFDDETTAFYASNEFKEKEQSVKSFLNSLPPYMDGRNVTLKNVYNVYDYMNVNYIHNSTFFKGLPPGYLEQARDLANWHEYNIFSDSEIDSVGSVAGRTILPSILNSLQRISNSTDTLKLVLEGISYKPFISLFNMTGAESQTSSLSGIVNYASAMSFELHDVDGEHMVRLRFKNGTTDTAFKTYPWFGSTEDVALSKLQAKLQPAAINSTAAWCKACGNTVDRGCGALALAASNAKEHGISRIGAGFVGAGVTIGVFAVLLTALFFSGMINFGRREKRRVRRPSRDDQSDSYPLGVNVTDSGSDYKS